MISEQQYNRLISNCQIVFMWSQLWRGYELAKEIKDNFGIEFYKSNIRRLHLERKKRSRVQALIQNMHHDTTGPLSAGMPVKVLPFLNLHAVDQAVRYKEYAPVWKQHLFFINMNDKYPRFPLWIQAKYFTKVDGK